MNEMIYGNTGRRDEGINIDMDQALYQKLQSRTFVPKLKSMLNDFLQEGDKNFVFIGELADKSGNYSIYGYNAKLESDSRGGDYGHYVALPAGEKTATVETDKVEFLTEDGFVEYVNLKTLNNEKRFRITSSSIDVDVNVKKRLVNNLMETFTKGRKRKNVTFSFDDCGVEEFTAKSLFILLDLMKYLPYRMRKNISFISHVASNQKLPDMINLAAYPNSSEYVPHDCININAGGGTVTDGLFVGYVEKVFAMNDAEREEYLETIYTEIELPAIQKGVDVKSDLYLLDISTKELWTSGDVNQAVASIFSSVDDVLAVYPMFKEIAKKRIIENSNEVVAYLKARIEETQNPEELKVVYDNARSLFSVCELQFNEGVVGLFKNHASVFVNQADSDKEVIDVTAGIVASSSDVLDLDVVRNKLKLNMGKKSDINGIYVFYLGLKEKNAVEQRELDVCLAESVETLIHQETASCTEAKAKLATLERMYNEFTDACTGGDYSTVSEVYASFKEKYSSGANNEAISKGNDILSQIDLGLRGYCNFLDVKNYILMLSEVEVNASETMRQNACDIYRRVSAKMFEELRNIRLDYVELKRLINEIAPAVRMLHEYGVYDAPLHSGWGQEKYVPDGLYSFGTTFESLINGVGPSETLMDALLHYENAKGKIKDDEPGVKSLFEKFAPMVLHNWLHKHKKHASVGNLKRTEKDIRKIHNMELAEDTLQAFNSFNIGKKKSNPFMIIILILIGLILIAGVVFGGIMVINCINGNGEVQTDPADDTVDTAKYFVTEAEKADIEKEVEEYLKAFDSENMNSPMVVLGKLSKKKAEDVPVNEGEESYILNITEIIVTSEEQKDSLGDETPVKYEETSNSKKKIVLGKDDISAEKDYAIVVQLSKNLDDRTVYVRDIFEIPENLKEYNFNDVIDENENPQYYFKLVKYIGLKMELISVNSTVSEKSAEAPKAADEGNEKQVETPKPKNNDNADVGNTGGAASTQNEKPIQGAAD